MAVSFSSATVAVEKATSDLLIGPDWTMNIEICDSINSHHWQPKDVVKAVKKRLQHKSSKVQLLALTLLETMVKNCGDNVHFQIAERNILGEMNKIVRKKADMQVRDKILLLLDSWQEAFGGSGGKHPQYYWAYEELRRSGVVFPKRSPDAAPIFTPPPTHPALRHMQPGYGMPSNSSKTLDETMATEIESLSFSSLDSMQQVLDLLSDMLQAVNPNDREAVKDEVIIDLVDRCRSNQKKLMQMLTTTGDEELLGRGLELNDSIQSLLARHDAIASGTPFPYQGASSSTLSSEVDYSANQTEVKSSSPASTPNSKASSSALVCADTSGLSDEEEEDEFAQLARRHSKTHSVTSKDASTGGSSENSASVNTSNATPHGLEPSTSVPSNALVLSNPPAPVSTAKDQDIIDLLSLTLSVTPSSPPTTYTPSASSQGMHQIPVPSRTEGYSHSPQPYPGSLPFDSYVVPWAQPQPESEFQAQSQSRSQPATPPSHQQLRSQFGSEQALQHQQTQQSQSRPQLQNQHIQYNPPQQFQPQPLQYQQQPHINPQPQHHHPHFQPQPQQPHPHLQSHPQPQHIQQSQPQPQLQLQLQNQHLQYPGSYPPPPWAATPGYPNYQANAPYTSAAAGVRPLQPTYSFPSTGISGPAITGDPAGSPGPNNPANATGQRPFIPSYRLFEDLNVFGNTDGRTKMTASGTSPKVSGTTMGPGMVAGRK